jgi:N-ethylmaleimide reductase
VKIHTWEDLKHKWQIVKILQNYRHVKNKIFKKYDIKDLRLKNRIVMAPMTRSRTLQPGDIPSELNALYYRQRASAGLIISEATQISLQGQGYALTPGIYTQEQVEGWKLITKAVHKANGKIFLQLWHVGRVSNHFVNNMQPVAPSPIIARDTSVYIIENGEAKFVPAELPKALTVNEIQHIILDFVQAANNAMEAGFDGVEIHGANGYLIDQFLRSNSNQRTDEYGGTKENRIRLLLEVTKAVIQAIGTEKTGVRLSPFITYKDMADPEILGAIILAAKELNKLGATYIHLCEADWDDAPKVPTLFRQELREIFHNTIIATGGYTPEKAKTMINSNLVDMIGFGRLFIANPDLPKRMKQNGPYNELKNYGLFGGDEKGFTDYPFLQSEKT